MFKCAVSALKDVQWSPESFDYLKIPPKTKTILSSLAKACLRLVPAVPFDDVIDGKGRGLTVLLQHVMARLVLERPLLSKQLQSGSIFLFIPYRPVSLLSTTVTPMRLSNDLKPFSRLPHFEAVLLLDEADAFMEQRTSYHDTHNRLVAVFLRRIEYYQGLMFLTTSRKIQLNESIISRIHLTIKYEDLTTEFRREIWRTYLSKANTVQGPAIVGPNELQFLDNLSLNGREIKNLTSIAHALATVGEEPVSYKYLEMAAELSEEFSKEFSEESHVESMYV